MNDYIEFLALLAKGIGKKHERNITLSCDLSGLLRRQGLSTSWYQIITNNDTLIQKSIKNKTDHWIDRDFKNNLKSNIKNHLPSKLYNYLVMKSIDDKYNLGDLLNYSGWEVLELLLETICHDTEFRSFFVKINNEKIEIIPSDQKSIEKIL